MGRLMVLMFLALAGCIANPPAEPNPNSVPNVLQEITFLRSQPGAIFVAGGLNDGAAAGQTTRLVVMPDDNLVCTFRQAPALSGDGARTTVTAHRLQVSGLYAAVETALMPNVVAPGAAPSFQVEILSPAGLSQSHTGFGDPRLDGLLAVFTTFPTPCWAFG